jgi:hypothetical protein
MQVAEHLAADAKHQGPMALEDRSEGRFITLGDELPEQFAVTVLRDLFIASKAADVTQDIRQGIGRHVLSSTLPRVCINKTVAGVKRIHFSLPKDFVTTPQTWVGYDALNDVLYIMKAGRDLYKLARR